VAELIRGAESENTITGYAWCLASVIFYAVYEVVYGKYVKAADDPFMIANSQRFFGLAGLLTLLVVWPMFFILNATHIEDFAWPTSEQWKWIAVVVVCDTSFNLFLVLTIVLTNPLFTSVGTILVIPISTLVDYLINGTLLPAPAFGGVGLIIVGFSAIVYAEHKDHQAKHNHKL
jgi:drug/metabolite transporter (DMT)-like permease